MNAALVFVLPILGSVAVGIFIGFWIRSNTVDHLRAEIVNLKATLEGREIRTSRAPEAPVQPSARPAGTRRPVQRADTAQARTEPLPANVRYMPFVEADEDELLTNAEYAERYGSEN